MGGILSVLSYFSIRTHRHLFGYYSRKSFTFSSKSKEQLLLEYNGLNAVSGRYFYLQIFNEIKNAVISDDVDCLKTLSGLLNYVIASKSFEVMQKYEQNALETVGKINLITLSCKASAGKILEYLLSDENGNFVLPLRVDRSDLSPDEEDDESHNAFYYAIRSNVTSLLEILIDKWPNSYLKDTLKLDDILSKAFNEVLVRNIPLNKDMELYVKKRLVDLRFFEVSSQKKPQPQNNPKDLLMLRIGYVLEKIDFIVTNYCDDENEMDEQFLLAAKYIAQNIHTIKSQLNFTYDRLPWEEMEFCLIIFIRFCLKPFCFEPLYSFVLNKERLLSHLEKFSSRLACVKEELKTIDISNVPNKRITRKEVIEKDENKLFEDLYKDFKELRDIYTLEKIKKYTDIALSADPSNKEGHILITRALQVTGEHFNNTLSSPKLSDVAADFLLSVLPRNLAEIITNLRNSLSHLQAFCLRGEIEENDNSFFANIQSDIAKISSAISDILYRVKITVVINLLKEITSHESTARKKIFVDLNHASWTKILEETKHLNLGEIGLLEKLVLNLETELDKEINYSKQMFHRLHDVIEGRSPTIPQQSTDITSKLRDSLLSSDTKEILKYLDHVLSNVDCTSLLTENEQFVTDGKINIDIVTEIMRNIFVKVSLRENKAILNRIKERDTTTSCKFFPQCDDLLERLPDEVEMDDYCTPEQIRMLKKLVVNVEALIESKSYGDKEQFRRILSMIAEKKRSLKSVHEELSEILKCNFSMVHTEDKYYSSTTLMRDIYKFQKKLESMMQEMNLKSFSDELYIIAQSISSRMLLQYGERSKDLEKALLDIFDFVIFRMGNVKWIKEFRHMIHSHKIVKPYTFANEVYTLKPDFAQQLSLKISLLRSVLKNNNLESLSCEKLQAFEKNMELQTLVEMLVLDILSVIEGLRKQLTHISYYLDSYYPMAYGRNLRNHIAHGNALVEMLLGESFANLLLNAQKIIEVEDILQEKLGRIVENDPVKSKKSHDIDSSIMKKQKQFFFSLTKGIDEIQMKDFILKGVDIYGRDLNSCSALHYAAKSPNLEILRCLLTFNLDINAKDDSYQTVLHVAANSGRERIVEYLLKEMKMPVGSKDINGKTPLHLASGKGHESVVRLLLKHKANTFLKDVFGYAPLHYAVLENHSNIVSILLENLSHVDDNQTFYGFTALHLAAAKGHLDLVNSLLEKEANVNFKSDMDFMPLHYAAGGGHFEVVKFLLMKGAEPNAQTVLGLTPLHLAIDSGDLATITILLRQGAEVNAAYLDGFTPLHFAVGYGRFAALKLLMEEGAATALPSGDGATPLDIAASVGHCELVEELLNGSDMYSKIRVLQTAASKGNLAVVELLFGCGVDTKPLLDSTALHFAAEEGHVDTVTFLLDRGANINAQDENGDTALHVSSSKMRKEVVQLLIKRKADILIKNNKGTFPLEIIVWNGMTNFLIEEKVVIDFFYANDVSPFHFGAFYGDIDFVKYCIEKGCPIDIRTKSSSTALLLATLGGHVEVVSFLLKNKADINAEDQKGCTALKHAVNGNNKKILEILIKNKVNLSAEKERTLFLSAVTQGHADIVDIFLSKNPDVGVSNSQISEFPLHTAAYFGHVSIVKKMLEKVKKDEINVRDKSSKTPLLIATERNHCEIVQLLLSKGADPAVPSKYGELPLLIAIEKGSSKMVEILLNSGADCLNKDSKEKISIDFESESKHSNIVEGHLQNSSIYNINQKESSLLHIAASFGSLEIVQTLINNKADINCRDLSGAKPIHLAAKEGYRDVLECFLNLGVAVDETGENNWTLMHYAAAGNHFETCKFLSERSADVNAVDADGATPLHVAAESGNLEALLALLEIGAFYDARDKNNKTPLQITKWWNMRLRISLMFVSNMFSAVQSDNHFKLECVLSTGLDILKFNFVNVKNAKNIAPIHYAAWKGYEKIANILLRYKANPNLRTKNYWTSLHYAAKFSHYKIVKDLLCNGTIFEAMSDSGKTPLHYSTDKDIVAILEFLKNIFLKIQNKDSSSLEDLKAIEDMDTVKAIMRAKNLQLRTLTTVAILSDHPGTDELKEIFQTDVFVSLKMAEMSYRHGNYEESFNLYQVVLQKRIDIFEQDDPAVLDIQKKLAMLLLQLCDYDRALTLAQKIYETLQSILGESNRETLTVKCLIALILDRAGLEQKALQIYREVSEKQREVFGLNHRETLETLTSMAALLYKEKKFEMALKVNEEIFKTLTEYHENSPWTLRIQTNIAKILRKQKKFLESLELFRNISEEKEKIFGYSENQETLEIWTEIAKTLLCMGEEEESLKIHRKNIEIQFSLLGPNHPNTLRSRSYISDILYSQRKFREALGIYTEVLNARILILGANHPSIEKTRKRIDFINSHIKNPVL